MMMNNIDYQKVKDVTIMILSFIAGFFGRDLF
jgi:hypothetical protein